MEEDQAAKFIHRMFSHAAHDRVAILVVPRRGGKAEQRVFTLPQATSQKVQAWLRHLNVCDYDIYLCVNPVRTGSRGREKDDIDEVRRLQLDLDDARKSHIGKGATGEWQKTKGVKRFQFGSIWSIAATMPELASRQLLTGISR